MTASVRWPPKELVLVVVTIKPAKANNETDKMTKAISTSMSENPFDFIVRFNVSPPIIEFWLLDAKPVPRGFGIVETEYRLTELFNRLNRLEVEIKYLGNNLPRMCFQVLMKSLN